MHKISNLRVQNMFFKFNPLFVVLTFPVTQVKVNMRETELDSTFETSSPLNSRISTLGFNFKCVSHHGQGKFSDWQYPDYWKMHLWNLAWSDHCPCETTPINLPQKSLFSMQSFFKKKVPHTLEEAMLYLHSKSFIPVVLRYKLWPFKQNYLATVFFKVTPYGYEIFQTVLSLNCKIN